MSAHVSPRPTHSPTERALFAGLGSVLVVGGLWLCGVFLGPGGSGESGAWPVLVAALLICPAGALAFSHEATARRWRQHATDVGAHATGLESDFYRLCQE